MKKQIYMTRMNWGGKTFLFRLLMEGQYPLEIEAEPMEKSTLLGNIYVGKVETVAPGIHAAFVKIGQNQTAFLSLSQIRSEYLIKKGKDPEIRPGDELLVQVSREAQKTKLPSVTTELSLSGTYLVLYYGEAKVSFSNRLSAADISRLKEKLPVILPKEPGDISFGVIFRTSSTYASTEELQREYQLLHQKLENLIRYGLMRTAFSCLSSSSAEVPDMIRRYGPELEELVTDDKNSYEDGIRYVTGQQFSGTRVTLWEDSLIPLYKKINLESLLEKVLSEKISLPSGGFLVIQPTEAFVSIDVNSGKQLGKNKKKDFIYRVNLEAAVEIARQLRLRQLSGLILIDFMNLPDPMQEEQLLQTLRDLVRKDPIPTKVVDMTPLHIVEVTRKKVKKPLFEQIGGIQA